MTKYLGNTDPVAHMVFGGAQGERMTLARLKSALESPSAHKLINTSVSNGPRFIELSDNGEIEVWEKEGSNLVHKNMTLKEFWNTYKNRKNDIWIGKTQ